MRRDPAALATAVMNRCRQLPEGVDGLHQAAAVLLAACEVIGATSAELRPSDRRAWSVLRREAPWDGREGAFLLACLLAVDAALGSAWVAGAAPVPQLAEGGYHLGGEVLHLRRPPRGALAPGGDRPQDWALAARHQLQHGWVWWNSPTRPATVGWGPAWARGRKPWSWGPDAPRTLLLVPGVGAAPPEVVVHLRNGTPRFYVRRAAGRLPTAVPPSPEAALVLLPELLVHPDEHPALCQRAAGAVAAGSWHVDEGPEGWRNRAALLDRGAVRAEHHKRAPFHLRVRELRSAGAADPDGVLAASAEEAQVPEDLWRGDRIELFLSPFGVTASVICADLLMPGVGYSDTLQALAPDLLLVHAMSRRTRDFEAAMQNLARVGATTAMVNAACVAEGDALLAAVWSPALRRPLTWRKDRAPDLHGEAAWVEEAALWVDLADTSR